MNFAPSLSITHWMDTVSTDAYVEDGNMTWSVNSVKSFANSAPCHQYKLQVTSQTLNHFPRHHPTHKIQTTIYHHGHLPLQSTTIKTQKIHPPTSFLFLVHLLILAYLYHPPLFPILSIQIFSNFKEQDNNFFPSTRLSWPFVYKRISNFFCLDSLCNSGWFSRFSRGVNVGSVVLGEIAGREGGRLTGHYAFVDCHRKLEALSWFWRAWKEVGKFRVEGVGEAFG